MAGKDVSRAMATQNLEEKDYVSDLVSLGSLVNINNIMPVNLKLLFL